MGRRTKEPLEITVEAVEENESPELNEDPVAVSEDVEEEIAPPKPRARRPRRKRNEPKAVATDEANAEAVTEIVAAPIEAPTAEEAPAPMPIPAPTPIPPMPIADTFAATAPTGEVKENAETILKQWQSINAISQGICHNLERVNAMVKELPANYADAIAELLKPPAPKPTPLTKLAAGVSIAAAILSVLSLSLSQSARQAILSRDVAPTTASAPAPRPAEQVVYHAPAPASAPVQQAPMLPQHRVSAPIAMAPLQHRRVAPAPAPRHHAKEVVRHGR